jgi:hypothetical protein
MVWGEFGETFWADFFWLDLLLLLFVVVGLALV